MGRASTEAANWDYSLPVKITNCNGFGLVFAGIYSDSDADLKNIKATGNKFRARASSAAFYEVFNKGNISRSTFDNSIEADSRVIEFAANNYAINDGEAGSFAVKLNGTFIIRLADDEAAPVGLVAYHSGARPVLALSSHSGGRGLYEFRSDNASPTLAGAITFTNLEGTTAPEALTGTTGTDGKFTLGITSGGMLFAENRSGQERYLRVSVLS